METGIDLHTHSTASDGSDRPGLLVRNAVRAGLSAVALTDHDTVSGLEEASAAARSAGLRFVPGVELSTALHGKEIHIVGLFIDPVSAGLVRFLEERRADRDARNAQMIARLNEAGYPLTEEEVREAAGGESTGRPHMARVLVRKGFFPGMKEAFDACLKRGRSCYVPRKPVPPSDGIRVIHEAGGLAFWAHPVLAAPSRSAMRRVLREMAPAGLDGIETRYSMYTPVQEKASSDIAHEFQLLESGGSDYHGLNSPGVQLGTGTGGLYVPSSFLEKMLKLSVNLQ